MVCTGNFIQENPVWSSSTKIRSVHVAFSFTIYTIHKNISFKNRYFGKGDISQKYTQMYYISTNELA